MPMVFFLRNVSQTNVFTSGKICLIQICLMTLRTWTGTKFMCEILNVPLTLVLGHFILRYFIMPLLLMSFYIKLSGKILLTACYVKNFLNQLFIFFCKCEAVKPLWDDLINIIRDKHDTGFSISYFDIIFGIQDDRFITYLFLCLKYFLYLCKFQNKIPNFAHFINFVKSNRETEYFIAKRRDKLSNHYKKWRFDF